MCRAALPVTKVPPNSTPIIPIWKYKAGEACSLTLSGIPKSCTAALLVMEPKNMCQSARQMGKLKPEYVITCLFTMMMETEHTIQKATHNAVYSREA